MNDEQLFLANAYLDGELTADERAIAEADPAVMAEVEQLRALQARMRAVDLPSAATRERAIAAAMAEFGAASAPTAAPAAVTARAQARTPFWSRPAQRRYLAIAAAVVAVGTLGVIVSQFGRGGGDDADLAGEAVDDVDLADEPESSPASAQAETARDGDEGGEEATADSATNAATEMTAEAVEESGGSEEIAPTLDVAEDTEEASLEAPPFASAPPDFDPAAPVSDPAELGAFGRYLLDEQAADRLGPTPNTACPADFNILGETTLVDDQDSIDVYVGVLEAERTVLAIDRDACDVLVASPLTEPTGP